MDPDAAERRNQGEENTPDGFIGLAGDSLSAARRFAGDVTELAALELRLATTTAIRMAVGGLLVLVAVCAAWILAQVALAFLLANVGWPMAAVLGVLAAINLIAGALLVWYIRHTSRRLTFPATRRLFFEKAQDDAHSHQDDPQSASSNRRGPRAA